MDRFVAEKGWYAEPSPKPQSPRNLAASLVLEAAEVMERFQWTDAPDPAGVAEEIADVVLYAAQLANALGLDLAECVSAKLAINRGRTW